jgi:putative ABC transport system substrate-binding protein
MKRRDLLYRGPACLAAPALAPALAQAQAQAQAGPKLLVVLTTFAKANFPEGETPLRQELARLGWRVGDNLRLELRYADNRPERLDELARELVALQPTAALTIDQPPVQALLRHSTRLPIVVGFAGDPVASGLAASLRRPGGQVTGLTMQYEDIRPKSYELARQVAPSARRLGGLFDRRIIPAGQLDAAMAGPRRIAQLVGLEYLPLPVRDSGEIESALRSLKPVREHVLLVNSDPLMFAHFESTAALARTLRLPSGSQHQSYVHAGGLFGYGPDLSSMLRRAVQMADQVLRGQPVGEIPFEQPTRIILALNRDTARSIGLTFSQELLLRADELIG